MLVGHGLATKVFVHLIFTPTMLSSMCTALVQMTSLIYRRVERADNGIKNQIKQKSSTLAVRTLKRNQ